MKQQHLQIFQLVLMEQQEQEQHILKYHKMIEQNGKKV
jgi:hypothetical protein